MIGHRRGRADMPVDGNAGHQLERATTGSWPGPWSSWWSRLTAALISDRWVNAWGKLPSCSPVWPISSAYRPTWLA